MFAFFGYDFFFFFKTLVDFFEVLKQRFRNSDSWVVPQKRCPERVLPALDQEMSRFRSFLLDASDFGFKSRDFDGATLLASGKGFFRWVKVSSASFVTCLLRNLQNALVGGNSSWFYRYKCRCRLNTNKFFRHSGTGSFHAEDTNLPVRSKPWSHGPIPDQTESLRLGISPIITSGMAPWICEGLSLCWKNTQVEERLNLFFLQNFDCEDFILQREMSSHHVNQILVVH